MAYLRLDPDKVLDLIRKYRPALTTREASGGSTEAIFACPFHPDQSPSYSFNVHKGIGNCFSCNTGAHLTKLVAKFENTTEDKVARIVKKVLLPSDEEEPGKKYGPGRSRKSLYTACNVSLETVHKQHQALLSNVTDLMAFSQLTGLTKETISKFLIGKDPKQGYWIPLIYANTVVNIKHYNPKGHPKYWGEEGANENILWPLENVYRPGDLWLVEGEKDCLTAIQHGLNAVTFTGGSKSISRQFLRFFKDKNVFICYDIDDAGTAGAWKVANIIYKVANSVRIVDLPTARMPTNGDLTNFFTTANGVVDELLHVASLTETHKGDNITTKIVIPDEVADTYLEEIIPNKLFFRRVRMHVRVTATGDNKAFLVPKELKIACAKDWKENQCLGCPMNYQEHNELEMVMRHYHPEILSVVESNDKKQREAIRSMIEIPLGCPRFKIEFVSHQSLYPIMIIPALEKDKVYHSYIMHEAWALDVPSLPNEDYLAEAVVMSNPETQGIAIICYKLDRDGSSADDFELDEETYKALEVFKCSPAQTSTTNLPTSTMT